MQIGERKAELLEHAVDRVIEESRMVLPGIQAIFGFQLIAVFNARFENDLLPYERYIHLAAIVLVAVSIALIMAPAAFHRQAEPGLISQYFVDLASRLLTMAMLPFLFAIVLEVFLVARLIVDAIGTSIGISAAVFALFAYLWFVFPRFVAKRRSSPASRQ
jgi:uncharacterized protein DUF6328